jgi:hypothetical protein
MFKSVIILFAIVLLGGLAMATPMNKKAPHKPENGKFITDSSRINVHQFNKTAIDNYRRDPAFDYSEHNAEMTWWDRFWQWVWDVWTNFWDWVARMFQKLFGSVSAGAHAASVFRLIIIIMFAGMIIYLVSRLIGVDLLKLFRKNQNIIDVPYSESLENIHEINFDESIETALAVKDYRLAVRLLYLRTLKQLSDANLISWKIEKTNTAYLHELKDAEQRKKFSIVTRQFEYVWYGEFPVDGRSFQSINAYFQDFKQSIS